MVFFNRINSKSALFKIVLIIVLCGVSMAFIQISNTPSNDYGEMKLIKDGKGMKVEFHPTNKVKCKRIVLTQTAQLVFKNGADVTPRAGDLAPYLRYLNKNTLANGTLVDHAATSTDPEINGLDRDRRRGVQGRHGTLEDLGDPGKRDGTDTAPSTTYDYPNMPDGAYPAGKTKYVLKIEVCASCADGEDVGVVYGCATWEYTKTKGANDAGSNSTSDATLDPPSSDFKKAVDLFEENHINEDGERYCPD